MKGTVCEVSLGRRRESSYGKGGRGMRSLRSSNFCFPRNFRDWLQLQPPSNSPLSLSIAYCICRVVGYIPCYLLINFTLTTVQLYQAKSSFKIYLILKHLFNLLSIMNEARHPLLQLNHRLLRNYVSKIDTWLMDVHFFFHMFDRCPDFHFFNRINHRLLRISYYQNKGVCG